MKNKLRQKGEQRLRYYLRRFGGNNNFDILYEISENVTLVQLMEPI